MNERKFGLYIFLGIGICALIGAGFGLANGNVFNRFWIGALIGVFIGWFIAVAARERQK